MRDVSDGMASVNTAIGYGSQLKERGQPKKSDIGNTSELSIKTCSVNEAFVIITRWEGLAMVCLREDSTYFFLYIKTV